MAKKQKKTAKKQCIKAKGEDKPIKITLTIKEGKKEIAKIKSTCASFTRLGEILRQINDIGNFNADRGCKKR